MTQSEIALNWTCPILSQTGRKSGLFNMFIWTCPIAGVALFCWHSISHAHKKILDQIFEISQKVFLHIFWPAHKNFWTKFSKFPKIFLHIFCHAQNFRNFPKSILHIFGHAHKNFLDQIFEISQKVFLHIFSHAHKKFWTKFSKFSKKYFYMFLATPTKNFWTKFSKFPKKSNQDRARTKERSSES